MKWINDIIKSNFERIFEYQSLQEFCFWYLYDKTKLETKDIDELQGEEEILAAKGYKNISPTEDEIVIIDQQESKIISHYKNNKYKLIGFCLALGKNNKAYTYLEEFTQEAEIVELFLIQKFFPEFEETFKNKLEQESENDTSSKILKYIFLNRFESEIDNLITEQGRKDLEITDLVVLSELQIFYSKQAIQKITYTNLSANSLIINILENFENAVIKITDPKERYGGKTQNPKKQPKSIIKIEDEYDVQDILYVVLKSVFPTMKYENPLAKHGGTSTRLDFVLMEEGIIIEVKQITVKEKNDKKFINQMKIDLESYHVLDYLQTIIFFIYAPNAIQDIDNFKELEGERSIKGKSFDVKVIVVR